MSLLRKAKLSGLWQNRSAKRERGKPNVWGNGRKTVFGRVRDAVKHLGQLAFSSKAFLLFFFFIFYKCCVKRRPPFVSLHSYVLSAGVYWQLHTSAKVLQVALLNFHYSESDWLTVVAHECEYRQ